MQDIGVATGATSECSGGVVPPLAAPYGLVLLSQENVTETSPELADILYHYPKTSAVVDRVTSDPSAAPDPLLKWRGAAITLVHLMPQLTASGPVGYNNFFFQFIFFSLGRIVYWHNSYKDLILWSS